MEGVMKNCLGSSRLFVVGLLIGLVADAGATAQTTWRVPGDAATINDAIGLAAPGDRILLVSTNDYGWGNDQAGIVIDKALTLEPPAGQRARYFFSRVPSVAVHVTSLRGGRLILRNLDIVPDSPDNSISNTGSRVALLVGLPLTETGVIVLDNITSEGLLSNADDPCPGARVVAGAGVDLAIRNCLFVGATGDPNWISTGEVGWRGSAGAELNIAGDCIVENSTFVGGDGGYAWWTQYAHFLAKDGGPGLTFASTRGIVVASTVTDGKGGDVGAGSTYLGSENPCDYVGMPGRSTFRIDAADVIHRPAARGSARSCPQTPPPPRTLGAGVRDLTVGSQQLAGAAFTCSVRSLAFGEGWTLLALGTSATRYLLPGLDGALWVDGAFFFLPVTPRLTAAWVSVPMPVAPPLGDALDLTLQPLHLTSASMRWAFGTPATLTIFP